jgi:hypothetical protein
MKEIKDCHAPWATWGLGPISPGIGHLPEN